eukprot:9213007-Pyramimonas_sp.AAC.1
MDPIPGPEPLNDDTHLVQRRATVQWAQLAKSPVPVLMKHAQQAKDAGAQRPRLRQHRGDEDQDPERELAWLERGRLEQPMQSLA